MYLQNYIGLSLITYLIGCKYLSRFEDKTDQRHLAFKRSIANFICVLVIVLMHNLKMPTKNNSWLGDLYVLIVWFVAAEVIFSTGHYTLHNKHLYWIHKQHHENNPSFSTSSLDSNFIEFVTTNIFSIALPMYVCPGSLPLGIFWVVFVTVNTCIAHSKEGDHLKHHKMFNYNYGQGTYLFDKIMGTYLKN
tara:strand:+ start:74 stop:646 length:573 start_codon:yes stop_codon:yes gene_type:complete